MTPNAQPDRYGAQWSRDDLILAFELYCRIPFRKTKASNPEVQALARLLGRSPAAIARKLGNFGAFDPELRKQNIKGLTHVGRLDREVWDEFHRSWNDLVWAASRLRKSLVKARHMEEVFVEPSGPSEKLRTAKQRVHQSFFRQAVLSSYEETCCVTGLGLPECLIASHIVPWSCDERFRTDPTNGLCLSATFDRLFEKGLFTLSDDLSVRVARRLLRFAETEVQELICLHHGKPIHKPRRFLPSPRHLRWHRSNVFIG